MLLVFLLLLLVLVIQIIILVLQFRNCKKCPETFDPKTVTFQPISRVSSPAKQEVSTGCAPFEALDYSPVMCQSYSALDPKLIGNFYKTMLTIATNNPGAFQKYDGVQLPVPTGPTPYCDTKWDTQKQDDWCRMGYVPVFYYDLDPNGQKIMPQTYFGSQQDHQALLDRLNNLCVLPVADVVFNHRDRFAPDTFVRPQMGSLLGSIARQDPVWESTDPVNQGCVLASKAADAPQDASIQKGWQDFATKNPTDWCVKGILYEENKTPISDPLRVYRYNDPCNATDPQCGMFGHELAHGIGDEPGQPNAVRRDCLALLQLLQEHGYKGWRFDFVKSIYASAIGYYVKQTGNPYNVGEYFDGDLSKLIGWIQYTGNTKVRLFDFPLFFILNAGNNAVLRTLDFSPLNAYGKQPGLVGQMPENAVTFIENHDTFHDDKYRCPGGAEILGYCYILTHPGIPQVFALHDYELADVNALTNQKPAFAKNYNPSWFKGMSPDLNKLIALRKRARITDDNTKVNIILAANKAYRAQITGKASSVYVKFGNDTFSPGTEWTNVVSGTTNTVSAGPMGYAVFEKVL